MSERTEFAGKSSSRFLGVITQGPFLPILRHEEINDKDLEDISKAIKTRSVSLKELSLEFDWPEHMKTRLIFGNKITNIGLGYFSEALKTLASLETLGLSFYR